MLDKMVKTDEFVKLMALHAKQCLDYLIEQNIAFFVIANTKGINFDPPLPKNLSDTFSDMIHFDIANYTLSTANTKKDVFEFEAGFGAENIGSLVTISYENIKQLIVEKSCIFINISEPKEKSDINASMKAFLSNPQNQEFLKNK